MTSFEDQKPTKSKASSRAFKVGLFVFFLFISAGLRLYSLGKSSYWIDEMVSLHFSTRDYWGAIFWDNNPFLYHLLLREWVKLVGNGEGATRLLSVIFSVSTTGILFCLGDMVAGLGCACLMALIHCFFPLSILYAQETRMYALFEMTMALHLFYFYRFAVLQKKSLGFFFTIPFLCLTHYLAIVPLSLEGVWLVTQIKDLKIRQRFFVGLILGAGILAGSYIHFFSWKFLEWQKFKFQVEPESRWPGRILWVWCEQNAIAAWGVSLLLIFSILRMVRTPSKYKAQFFFLFFPVSTLGIMWVLALVTSRGVFLPRYFIFTVPFVIAWLALALVEANQSYRLLPLICVPLIFGGTLLYLPQVYISTKSPWRDAAQYVTSFPKSIAFTTRTAALKTPYFEAKGVDVKKWEVTPEGLAILIGSFGQFENVWMIENFYGGTQYFERLKVRLERNGLTTSQKRFQTEASEPVLVMRIQCPNHSPNP